MTHDLAVRRAVTVLGQSPSCGLFQHSGFAGPQDDYGLHSVF